MADILVCLQLDTTELSRDLERIERGELPTPTVSAVKALIDGVGSEDVLIYLGSE